MFFTLSLLSLRLNLKAERLLRLRKTLDGHAHKLLSSHTEKVSVVQDKISLLAHRLSDLQNKVSIDSATNTTIDLFYLRAAFNTNDPASYSMTRLAA